MKDINMSNVLENIKFFFSEDYPEIFQTRLESEKFEIFLEKELESFKEEVEEDCENDFEIDFESYEDEYHGLQEDVSDACETLDDIIENIELERLEGLKIIEELKDFSRTLKGL